MLTLQGAAEEDRLHRLDKAAKSFRQKKRSKGSKSGGLSKRPRPSPGMLGANIESQPMLAGTDGDVEDGAISSQDEISVESDRWLESDDDEPVPKWIVQQVEASDRGLALEAKKKKASAVPVRKEEQLRFKAKPSAAPMAAAGSEDAVPAAAPAAVPVDASAAAAVDVSAAEMPGASKKRTRTEKVLSVGESGSIHFYPHTQNFVAFCRVAGHTECRKSRTAKASRVGRPGQGRPLGLLMRWLMAAPDFSDKEAHAEQAVTSSFTQADRAAAREQFKRIPGADEFLGYERPAEAGEPEEPPIIQ